MLNLYENSVLDFLGLQENANPLVVKPDSSLRVYAREMQNIRRSDGRLESIYGTSLHSAINYKMADRPTTLIRFVPENGTPLFIATAWDNFLSFVGSSWVPLLPERLHSGYTPSGLVYGEIAAGGFVGGHVSYVNHPWDFAAYNDRLYLADGFNLPMKTDGAKSGTWGFKKFTSVSSVLDGTEQAAAGVLQDTGDYKYYASLYESERELWGERGDTAFSINLTANNKKVWVHIAGGVWPLADNYDMENQFADKLKIWRSKTGGSTNLRLVTTLTKGLIYAGNGVFTDLGATGTLVDASADFVTDGVTAGYAIQIGAVYKQVQSRTDLHTLVLVNDDGGAYTPIGVSPEALNYMVWAGFIDNTNDLGDTNKYHTELIPVEDHSAPPRFKYCVMFNERAFGFCDDDNPSRCYYSEIGKPDYWPVENFIDIDPDTGDAITGGMVFQGRLLIIKRRSVAVLNADGAPVSWSVTPRYLSIGAPSIRCVADCDGRLGLLNTEGVWIFDGNEIPLNPTSHREDASNVKAIWQTVVMSKLDDARMSYDRSRDELIVSLTFDDSRNLYDDSITGTGTVMEDTTVLADGGGTIRPQNNGAVVYRFADRQWHYAPHKGGTCFCQFSGKNDSLELYRGDYHAAVMQENVARQIVTELGYSSQVTGAAAHPTYELKCAGAGWTTNEWAGGTVQLWRYDDDSTESFTILSNTSDTLAIGIIAVGPFWTTDPVLTDYFVIHKAGTSEGLRLIWRMQSVSFGRLGDLKWLMEFLAKVEGSGTIVFTWSTDEGEGRSGQFTWSLGDNGTYWDLNYWYDAADHPLGDSEYLVWASGEARTVQVPFPTTAEGRFFTVGFDITTSDEFAMTLLSLGYKINSGRGWRPR